MTGFPESDRSPCASCKTRLPDAACASMDTCKRLAAYQGAVRTTYRQAPGRNRIWDELETYAEADMSLLYPEQLKQEPKREKRPYVVGKNRQSRGSIRAQIEVLAGLGYESEQIAVQLKTSKQYVKNIISRWRREVV